MFKVTRGYVLAATLTSADQSTETPYPVFSSQTKDNGLMGYYKDYLYENAITWTTDGANAGTVNFRSGKFYCTNVCGVLLSNDVKASPSIAEALNNVAKSYVSYVGNPKLMNNVMAEIEICIPFEKDEQDKLSQVFTILDNLITLHQRKQNWQNLRFLRKISSLILAIAWEQRKVNSICEKTYGGGTPNTSDCEFWTGEIPWIQSSDIVEHNVLDVTVRKWISNKAIRSSATQHIPANSIAIITRVGVGKLAFMPFSYTTSQDFLSLSSLRINALFATYALYVKLQNDMNVVQGTSIKGITKDELLAKKIAVPNNPLEQERISALFKGIDNLITLHQCKRAAFMSRKSPSIFQFEKWKNTLTWEQCKLGSIVYRASEMSDTDDLPRVEYEDIDAGQGTLNKDLKEKVSTKKGIIFQSGDILYGKLRPYLKNWFFAWFSGIAVGDFWVLRSNQVSQSFIYRLVQTPAFEYIANQSTGSKMPRADWNLVSNTAFAFPTSNEEQEAIGQIFLKLDNLITLHQRGENIYNRRQTW